MRYKLETPDGIFKDENTIESAEPWCMEDSILDAAKMSTIKDGDTF